MNILISMFHIHRSEFFPYSSQKLFNLVNDIKSYKEFIPWCLKSNILENTNNFMRAELILSTGNMNFTFITYNILIPGISIEIHLEKGSVLKHLYGMWLFKDLGNNNCNISLDLHVEYKSACFTKKIINIMSLSITNIIVNAFCKRATKLYGNNNSNFKIH